MSKAFMSVVVTLITASACGPAQASPQQGQPTAREVLARFVRVTGGKENYAKVRTYVISQTLFQDNKQAGKIGLTGQIKPMLQYQQLEMNPAAKDQPGIRIIRRFTGKLAWEKSSKGGLRLLQGLEFEQARREAGFVAELAPEKFFKSMRVLGTERVDGDDCYKLELMPLAGKPEIAFYSIRTGFKVRSLQSLVSPQGEVRVDSRYQDYRKVGDIMAAHQVTQRIPKSKLVKKDLVYTIRTRKIVFNREIPANAFRVPDEVKTLAQATKKPAKLPPEKK